MHKVFGYGLVLLGACGLLAACSGSDDATGNGAGAGGSSAGSGGGGTGGGTAGGAGTAGTGGGTAGSAGTAGTGGGTAGSAGMAGTGGGTAGSAGMAGTGGGTGGAAGAGATGGAAGAGGDTFWPAAYTATGTSDPSNGEHNAGKNCGNCHTGGGAPAWSFAGTVYKTGGSTGAPHVEVGVRVNGATHTTYSGNNGNFFLQPGTTIDFSQAEVRIRNANGEKQMITGGGDRWCNSCHSTGMTLIEP